MSAQTIASNDRIRNESVARINACKQKAGRQREAQEPDARHNAQHERNREGQYAEVQTCFAILLHAAHLELQTCEKHDIVNANLTEELKRPIVGKQVEAIRPHENAGHNQSYDWRHTQSSQQ